VETEGDWDLAKARVLIIDEVGMYDRKLFKILLKRHPPWATIIRYMAITTDPSGGRKTPYVEAVPSPRDFINAG